MFSRLKPQNPALNVFYDQKKGKISQFKPTSLVQPTLKNQVSALNCSLFRVCPVTVSFKKSAFFLPGAVIHEKRGFPFRAVLSRDLRQKSSFLTFLRVF